MSVCGLPVSLSRKDWEAIRQETETLSDEERDQAIYDYAWRKFQLEQKALYSSDKFDL